MAAAAAGGGMGAIKRSIGDAVITFMWVFCLPTLGPLTSIVASLLHIEGLFTLLVTILLVTLLVLLFSLMGKALGGASFNPTATVSFYAAGVGGDNLISMAFRFPAQALGAVGGTLAIKEFMPAPYKHRLGGPSLKVDMHTGAIAEGVLTFLISFAVLFIVLRGPKNPLLKILLIAMSTVGLARAGSGYTGPSLNPANAFGWAYVYNRHNTWEQFYVYWICPFLGAILAAWLFRIIFPPPPPPPPTKEKKA